MLPTLSSLSVSKSPVGRLRHRCSSEYLRISPLHSEFRQPLLHSRKTVSTAVHGLSPWISQLTCFPACAPFTPSNSGQRLPPTYYRGCWHVVSRGLLLSYRHCSSLRTEVYNPKTVFLHAALLHQACAHCAIFPTAASRRSLGRISVPMWPVALSGRLPVEATVDRYPAVKLIGRDPIPYRESFPRRPCDQLEHPALPPVSRSYSGVWGRSVTHYSPVRHSHHQAKPDGSRSTCMC